MTGIGAATPTRGGAGVGKTEFETILENFKKEAAKTPAEKARDKVLERHRLDEEGYKRLAPAEKTKIDAEIAEAVKRVTTRRVDAAAPEGFDTLINRVG